MSTHKPADLNISKDAFSDGQIGSKLWLCEHLERVLQDQPPLLISVYAGWYGVLPLLLLSRGKLKIRKIILFDEDPEAVAAALKINDHWRFHGKFEAHRADVNSDLAAMRDESPDLVINTSCEHFIDQTWWHGLPAGATVALQSTNMEHPEHFQRARSLDDFRESFSPWAKILFAGQLDFAYTNFSFSRFSIIGIKGAGSSNHD